MTNPTGDALKSSAAQVRKGDDYQNKGDDHPTWGIHYTDHTGTHHNKIEVYGKDGEAIRDRILAALSPLEQAPQPVAWVADYAKSDGTTDFYVMLGHGERAMSLHAHRIRGRAEYEAAEVNHCLTGSPKPEFDDFDLDATPTEAPPVESQAAVDVVAERKRQIASEGWSPENDDKYKDHELTRAARCYLIGNPGYWPWSRDWWKPTDRRRDLVKAGALIIAEIERLDRASLAAEGSAETKS